MIYSTPVAKIMSRNRFELLMSMFHCSNNETADPNDRLCKIKNILNLVFENFKVVLTP